MAPPRKKAPPRGGAKAPARRGRPRKTVVEVEPVDTIETELIAEDESENAAATEPDDDLRPSPAPGIDVLEQIALLDIAEMVCAVLRTQAKIPLPPEARPSEIRDALQRLYVHE